MRQWGEGGSFSSMLLTISLLLLVTALGFLFGRVVIAKAYVKATGNLPKAAEATAPGGPPLTASQPASDGSDQSDANPSDTDRAASDNNRDSGDTSADQPNQASSADSTDANADQSSTESADTNRDVRYAVQVGAFSGEQSARRAQSELTNVGYPARIVRERQGTRSSYKVLAGHYRTKDDADAALTEVKREGFSEAFVVEER